MPVREDWNLNSLALTLGLKEELVELALTHPANRRMAWLGDAVLYLAVTEHLYTASEAPTSQLDPDRQRTIENPNLKRTAAEELHLNGLIHVPQSERDPNAKRIMATAFEALIGTLFLEKEYEVASEFVANLFSTIQSAGREPSYG